MSDNPADGLRRELEAVLNGLPRYWQPRECIDAIWPIVEAARADERERLQQENQELRAALKEANQANERLLMALDSGGV